MKRKNMLLAGILSAAMVMSGGGAIAAYAEETGSEAVVTENKDAAENADAAATDTDTAEEGADTTAENGDAAAEKAESADEKTEETEKQADANNSGSTQPPAFRMRDRLMQPPQSMPGSRNDAGAPTEEQKPEGGQLQGKDGAKEAFRRFMPGRMPENRPDGQNGAQDDRMKPWEVGNMDPFRGPQENNSQMPQENNGQMPQGSAPSGNMPAPQGGPNA